MQIFFCDFYELHGNHKNFIAAVYCRALYTTKSQNNFASQKYKFGAIWYTL